jgi:hypothetical protein
MCMYCKSYDLTESITIHVVDCNGCLIIIKNERKRYEQSIYLKNPENTGIVTI